MYIQRKLNMFEDQKNILPTVQNHSQKIANDVMAQICYKRNKYLNILCKIPIFDIRYNQKV